MPGMIYGRVLMLGLGKGDLIPKILRFPSVHQLVVIENDPAIIGAYTCTDARIRIVEADGPTYLRTDGAFYDYIVQDLPTMRGPQWIKTGPTQETAWVSV